MTAPEIIKQQELTLFSSKLEFIRALAEAQAWLGFKTKKWKMSDFRWFSQEAADHAATALRKEGLLVTIKGSYCKITIVCSK